jgi:hypothetical protein
MAHKDVCSDLYVGFRSRKLRSCLSGTAAVIGICLLLNCLGLADSACAQSKAKSAGGTAPRSASPDTPAADDTQQNIVAVVNGQQITRDQLAHECLRRHGEEVLESVVKRRQSPLDSSGVQESRHPNHQRRH